jgi:hypothetical protein
VGRSLARPLLFLGLLAAVLGAVAVLDEVT